VNKVKNKTRQQLIEELTALHQRVTELEKPTDRLHELESTYKSLLDYIPIGIGVATYDGKVLVYNKAMLEMTGYKRRLSCMRY
jgi:PAS domain-containing protein